MPYYKLLTPGPLTTTASVKAAMLEDHCTWDQDYKRITQEIRSELLDIAQVSSDEYTAVLMQGSGTFGVESAITTAVGREGKLLILSNGAYGERMEDIAKHAGLRYRIHRFHYNEVPDSETAARLLKEDPTITHVAMVHSETTTGILNELTSICGVVKAAGRTMMVDAMSSFGGVEIPVAELGIDFLISSANKCIQGVPGFAFVLCRIAALRQCRGRAVSLSLDLYDQWQGMCDGKWRFTSPTHTVLAFRQALREFRVEGGVAARQRRYQTNQRLLADEMKKLGFTSYIDQAHQGPIITTFYLPDSATYTFEEMYQYIKNRGHAIYPGKLTEAETFRIGTIGDIYPEDIHRLIDILRDFLALRAKA